MLRADATTKINDWLDKQITAPGAEITGATILDFLEKEIGMQPPGYFDHEKTYWFLTDEEEYSSNNPTRDYQLVGTQTERAASINNDYISGVSLEEIAEKNNVTRERIRQIIAKAIRQYEKTKVTGRSLDDFE